MRQVIIVEGSNYCGKTTITDLLKQQITGAIVLETHDYYHKHILLESPHLVKNLVSQDDFKNINQIALEKAENYINKRNEIVYDVVEKLPYDNIIIERSFLTQMVYRHLLFDNKNHKDLKQLIEKYVFYNAKLILVTASSETLKKRICFDNPKLLFRKASHIPYHLNTTDILIKKNTLYNYYFDRLENIQKYKIDTTTIDIENLTQKILDIIK